MATTTASSLVSACANIQAIASVSPPIACRITRSTPSSVIPQAFTAPLTLR
jgi:hypothetical protein